MPTTQNWSQLAATLADELHLATPPLAITFSDDAPDGVPAFGAPMPDALPDGRTGRVPAGCVFWIEAAARTFSTVAEDHGNCSVGSVTHGFKTLDEVAGNSDVAALLDSGWVTMDVVPQIPVVTERPGAVTYGPLAETPVDPDVVLLRVNGKQRRLRPQPRAHRHAAHGDDVRDPGVAAGRDRRVGAAALGCRQHRRQV